MEKLKKFNYIISVENINSEKELPYNGDHIFKPRLFRILDCRDEESYCMYLLKLPSMITKNVALLYFLAFCKDAEPEFYENEFSFSNSENAMIKFWFQDDVDRCALDISVNNDAIGVCVNLSSTFFINHISPPEYYFGPENCLETDYANDNNVNSVSQIINTEKAPLSTFSYRDYNVFKVWQIEEDTETMMLEFGMSHFKHGRNYLLVHLAPWARMGILTTSNQPGFIDDLDEQPIFRHRNFKNYCIIIFDSKIRTKTYLQCTKVTNPRNTESVIILLVNPKSRLWLQANMKLSFGLE